MSNDDSSAERAPGGKERRRGRAAIAGITALVAALAVGAAVLMIGTPPEQRASASQAEPASAAVAQADPTVGADSAPAATAAASPSEPADLAQATTPEASAPNALDADTSESHPILSDRSGERAPEVLTARDAVTAAEKQANALAVWSASQAVQPSYALTTSTGFQKAPPTPTPKPKPAVAAPAPRPLTNPTGGWIELPNVRPIPSNYYNAVHHWDPIVNHFAGVYKIDPDLIRRIIYTESKGYQYAYVASTGVKGLMQITPMWFKAGENPYDPYTNIGKGSYILRRGYDAYHTWFLAVTYYCYGPLGRYGGNVPTMYAGLIFSPIIRSL